MGSAKSKKTEAISEPISIVAKKESSRTTCSEWPHCERRPRAGRRSEERVCSAPTRRRVHVPNGAVPVPNGAAGARAKQGG
eukprot:2695775-Prymnesium_polylepis.1